MKFKEWQKNYHEKEIINLKKELTNKEQEIIESLGIKLKNKIYTEYEYESLKINLIKYYKNDDMDKEELDNVKPLVNGINRDEYNELLKKFDKLDKKYEVSFNKITF